MRVMYLWKETAEMDTPRWMTKMERKLVERMMSGNTFQFHLSDRESFEPPVWETTVRYHKEVIDKSNFSDVTVVFCSFAHLVGNCICFSTSLLFAVTCVSV